MSSLKDKLTGNCAECEERKQAILKAWRDTVEKIRKANKKRKK